MDDLEFDLGDEWFSLMLNDLDTSVFCDEIEPGDDAVSTAENINNNGAARKVLQPISTNSERIQYSGKDYDSYILAQKSKQTVYKDTTDNNRFKEFCLSLGETREIEKIPAEVLNQILCNFFMTVKRKDEKEYEPSSLSSFQSTFQRILIDKGSKINIKLDPQFEKSRNVLAARRKELTSMGYGNKPNAARNLEDEEIDVLYSKGYFGKHDPWALQRTVWWVSGLHFGFRARDEARKLKWGDIAVVKEANGEERLVFKTERATKTRTGEKPHGSKRKFDPPAYATGTERCPVGLYRFCEAQRPKAMN